MTAHSRLWIDDQGRLCETPPTQGVLLATEGQRLSGRLIAEHDLEEKDGKIRQKGKAAATPKSTPDALIADRTLWVTSKGVLTDSSPTKGIKIADKGEKIPRGYVVSHNLKETDGKIVQKSITKPENKMDSQGKNKGFTINYPRD